jgi:hypothetical protein
MDFQKLSKFFRLRSTSSDSLSSDASMEIELIDFSGRSLSSPDSMTSEPSSMALFDITESPFKRVPVISAPIVKPMGIKKAEGQFFTVEL